LNVLFPRPRTWRAGLIGLLFSAGVGGALAHDGHDHHPTSTAAPAATALAAEQPFLAENNVAMAQMMQAMAVQPTGDIDRDFVAMMAAHHQGAIDMAVVLLRHGSNQQLRRLAQEIIVTQQQEIAAMQLAIGAPLPPAAPAPTQIGPLAAAP
jgi:hypothetical protein